MKTMCLIRVRTVGVTSVISSLSRSNKLCSRLTAFGTFCLSAGSSSSLAFSGVMLSRRVSASSMCEGVIRVSPTCIPVGVKSRSREGRDGATVYAGGRKCR